MLEGILAGCLNLKKNDLVAKGMSLLCNPLCVCEMGGNFDEI